MNRFLLNTFAFIILGLLSYQSKAQLFFKNNTAYPVNVCYAMQETSRQFTGWFTNGWFRVEPNSKQQIAVSLTLNSIVYYYAKDDYGHVYGGTDGINLFVHPNEQFVIKNANMAYIGNENPAYISLPFRQVNLHSALKSKATIELNY